MNKIKPGKIILIIVIVALLGEVHMISAQNKKKTNIEAPSHEVIFTDGKWEEIAEKAKKNGRYIFVDAYTTWCAPCRQLKNVTFKEKNVAEYFNFNFINYTVDVEKGQGKDLAEKWDITAYPALLFFTPEGKMVMKWTGYVGAEQLVEIGKQAVAKK